MKKVIVTNNEKVEYLYSGKVEVIMLKEASGINVLQEGKNVASKGGRLLLDPTRSNGYYKSLVFLVDEEIQGPDDKSLSLLNQCITKNGKTTNKEPIIAGIFQNKDLGIVKKILN